MEQFIRRWTNIVGQGFSREWHPRQGVPRCNVSSVAFFFFFIVRPRVYIDIDAVLLFGIISTYSSGLYVRNLSVCFLASP